MEKYLVEDSKQEIKIYNLIAIPFKKSSVLSVILMVLTIIDGLSVTLQVIITTDLVNHVIEVLERGEQYRDWKEVILFCLVLGYQWLSQDIQQFLRVKLNIKVSEYLDVLIIQKISRLKYNNIENADSWNLISRVKPKLTGNVITLFGDVLGFISLILKIVGVIALIFTQVWWSAILIILLLLPLSILINRSAYANYEAEKKISDSTRRADYFRSLIGLKEVTDERELFGYGAFINKKYKDYYDNAQKVRFKVKKIWFVKMKAGSFVSSIFLSVIIFTFLNPVINGVISIGFFISITQAIFSMIQRLSWDLTGYVDRFATMNQFCKDVNNFFELEEEQEGKGNYSIKINQISSVEFDDVSFQYPGNEYYALKNVSFVMNQKRCYAFVGANGSGKTTIIKLLVGLYDNYTGCIRINGVDIREIPPERLHQLVYPLFQDYAQYKISIKDNILIGNVSCMNNNETVMHKVIDQVGMRKAIEDLPEGIETQLGKITDKSVELSGGQWQKVAIMRALVSTATLKILDEPTAALDPISESNLYNEFNHMMENSMTVLISHRLGATKLADVIFVIDHGTIIEKGTHDELINIAGTYAEMYKGQKEWYAV